MCQRLSHCCFTSTEIVWFIRPRSFNAALRPQRQFGWETVRIPVRDGETRTAMGRPGRPSLLSHRSWTLRLWLKTLSCYQQSLWEAGSCPPPPPPPIFTHTHTHTSFITPLGTCSAGTPRQLPATLLPMSSRSLSFWRWQAAARFLTPPPPHSHRVHGMLTASSGSPATLDRWSI